MTIQAKDYFVFDGVDSRSFDALVFDNDTFSSPEKQYETTTIPGRSGDLLLKNRRFGNVKHTYDVLIYRNFERNYEKLREFLLSRDGYCRLEDSLHPNEFYTAYYSGSITPEMTREHDMGKFSLTFSRKPQRWLRNGDSVVSTSWSTTLDVTNPTQFPCYPLIQVKGSSLASGSNGFKIRFYIGSSYYDRTTIAINAFSGSTAMTNLLNSNSESTPLCIDMDSLQAYIVSSGTTYYYNNIVKYTLSSDNKYPFQLQPGKNRIARTGSNLTFRVIPRWYTI